MGSIIYQCTLVQYGYRGKNCLVSDHTERTLCEIYSKVDYSINLKKILS